ncbi:DUF3489 domain-containing protein [Erythrobacter sp. EC-HK427]|uniref:DUF3489 domain-containing protein n=1 Tax=Erythrobacter sp. EC-HK427 TaxID=2038396 RepID=UPI001253ED3A|nr:DUF3489 domain-containing protein [Erythrobacter sp. EC-HK427]VVS96270.1 conserved hypothetical protein [Erythrobacter sp. EC-HK427]
MTKTTNNKPKRRYARTQKPAPEAAIEPTSIIEADTPRRETKISKVITMLSGAEGATLEQIVIATGWQAHTARAAMTGLKKKGHTVVREAVDGVSHYRISAATKA